MLGRVIRTLAGTFILWTKFIKQTYKKGPLPLLIMYFFFSRCLTVTVRF